METSELITRLFVIMPKFEIEVRETLAGTFFIEADSKEEAEKEFERQYEYGDIDFSDMESTGSEWKVVGEVKDDKEE